MHKNNLIIPVLFLLTGFISAYFIFAEQDNSNNSTAAINNEKQVADLLSSVNPFTEKKDNAESGQSNSTHQSENKRLDKVEHELSLIKQQLQNIEQSMQTLAAAPETAASSVNPVKTGRGRPPSILSQRLYNLDNLIKGGIAATTAEDIVRRKNAIELKRLELQDRARRDNYFNTQRYFDELDDINQQDINLREELGDESYDDYLYTSRQNNRIRIASVMLGSAAEQSGIQKGDIVLSYDNKRMFSWQELKEATAEGNLGEFVSISIVRNGEIYSFTVPRGPLGIQLGAARLEP